MNTLLYKIKNKVCKNMLLALPILGAWGFSSCSDFLEIEPLNDIVLENFWNEKGDVDNVVTSCYTGIQSSDCIARMMAWGEFRSDNVVGGTNYTNNTDLSNLFKENINSSNSFTTWECFYNVINRCNTVLYYAPQVAEKDPSYTESDLKATQAEVSALRDLCYFYLIRAFRDVPYITEPYLDDTQDMQQPASSFDDILYSLICDLENVRPYAVKTYPVNKSGYQTAFITQDAINSMLCDMYLWKRDYDNCIKYADLVINSLTERYQKQLDKMSGSMSASDEMIDGYPLISEKIGGSTYGQAYNDIFGSGNSRETIFELVFSSDESMPHNDAVTTYYGDQTTFPGIVKPSETISGDFKLDNPTMYLDKYDTRYFESIYYESGTSDLGINKFVTQSISIPTSTGSTIKAPTYGTKASSGMCSSNWIIYRLTDIMLMKAEALVQECHTDTLTAEDTELLTQAYNIVNTVNKRSNMNTARTDIDYKQYASRTLMTQLILDERQRELMFEGKRWFDLVRYSERLSKEGAANPTSYLVQKVQNRGSENGSAIGSRLSLLDALYWPYNKDELTTNKNLKQNPAYGSDDDDDGYQTTN